MEITDIISILLLVVTITTVIIEIIKINSVKAAIASLISILLLTGYASITSFIRGDMVFAVVTALVFFTSLLTKVPAIKERANKNEK